METKAKMQQHYRLDVNSSTSAKFKKKITKKCTNIF